MIGVDTAGSAVLNNQTTLGYAAISDKSNQVMIGDANVIEMVPNATATVNLGTATNQWNNININGNVTSTGGLFNSVDIVELNTSFSKSVITHTSVVSATYSILDTDVLISLKYTLTGIATVTLPLSSSVDIGKPYHIIDADGNALNNNITITTSGSDTVNGESSVLINTNYQSVSVYNDGSGKWFIF
jgi:hypothetical protein